MPICIAKAGRKTRNKERMTGFHFAGSSNFRKIAAFSGKKRKRNVFSLPAISKFRHPASQESSLGSINPKQKTARKDS